MNLSHIVGDQRRGMTDILLRNILGAGFDKMPEAVRRMRCIARTQDVRGISRQIHERKITIFQLDATTNMRGRIPRCAVLTGNDPARTFAYCFALCRVRSIAAHCFVR
jgi:hypothetical protein